MPYAYCDPTTLKVKNVTSKSDSGKPGQVEIQVADGHDVVQNRYAWMLDAAGTGIEVNLQAIKKRVKKRIVSAFGQMIDDLYDADAKFALLALYSEGSEKGWTVNRVPYIQTWLDWVFDALNTMFVKRVEVQALTTRAAVEAFDWTTDLDAEEALDPETKVKSALNKTS